MNHSTNSSKAMRVLLPIAAFLIGSLSANAGDYYCDFEVNGIYYQFISGKPNEVAVSYRNYETGRYGGNYTNYSGYIAVPATVTYNSVTYQVTAVTDHAFCECSSLTSVSLPNTITQVGGYAFADCPSLTWINLPSNLKSIGIGAFWGCIGLSSITIPSGVVSIGENAFKETAWYDNQPNGLIYAGKVAYQYKGTMPDDTQIVIKDGTIEITDRAFYNLSGLTAISIPDGLTTIGGSAFHGCSHLTSITIPNSVTSIGNGAFQYCSSLTSATLSNSVTRIGDYVFNGCSSLTSISIPGEVTNIGVMAFNNCTSLTSINIPKNVTTIASDAFRSCSGLTSINVETGNAIYDSRNSCNAIIKTGTNLLLVGCMNTIIPDGVTGIETLAFYYCTSLTSINIPGSVKNIGNHVFSYCDNLTDVYCYAEEIPSTGDAFYNSPIGSATLHVPASSFDTYSTTAPWSSFGTIVTIGPYFADANVEAICVKNWDTDGDGYLSFEEVEAVATLGDVFKGNTSVTSFDELQYFTGITGIVASAFSGCTSLTSFSIPQSVTSIANYAFSGCSSLTDVYCYAEEVPQASTSAFEGVNMASATLHVPAASADSYWTTSPWSDFGTLMTVDSQKIFYAISDETSSFNIAKEESESKVRFTHKFNGEWEALYLPFAIDYDAIREDFELAEIDGVVQNDDNNDGVADITVLSIIGFKGQMTVPNKPYLIRAKNAGEQTILFNDVTVYPTDEVTFDCSSFSTKYEFTGSYNTLNASALADRYVVQDGELSKGANTLGPCRWYMTATARNGASLNLPNRMRIMPVEDVITGIPQTADGKLSNGKCYDLSGRQIVNGKLQRGIYIIGGRKVVMK